MASSDVTSPDDTADTAANAATPSTTLATGTREKYPREDLLPSSSGALSSAGRVPIGAPVVLEFITSDATGKCLVSARGNEDAPDGHRESSMMSGFCR